MPRTQTLDQLLTHPQFVLFDLEYTAWPGSLEAKWSRPGESREIVQIGALIIDTATLHEIASFNRLVKPRVNPVLSDYFVNLTGISNEDIQHRGTSLDTALRAWVDFVGDLPVYSWGDEGPVFAENLNLLGCRTLAIPSTTDLRPWVIECVPQVRSATSGKLASALGSTLQFRAHDAIEDCRSIAEALRLLVAKSAASKHG